MRNRERNTEKGERGTRETGRQEKNKASTQWWGKLEKENCSLVTPRILEEPYFVANPVTLPVSSKVREWPPRGQLHWSGPCNMLQAKGALGET